MQALKEHGFIKLGMSALDERILAHLTDLDVSSGATVDDGYTIKLV